jgi:hypothetical protein
VHHTTIIDDKFLTKDAFTEGKLISLICFLFVTFVEKYGLMQTHFFAIDSANKRSKNTLNML